jgi:hypothetical protein
MFDIRFILTNRDKDSILNLLEIMMKKYENTRSRITYSSFLECICEVDRPDIEDIIISIFEKEPHARLIQILQYHNSNLLKSILPKLDREYSIFHIIEIISTLKRYPENVEKVINLKDENFYYFISEWSKLIKSVKDLKIEEVKEVVDKYLKELEIYHGTREEGHGTLHFTDSEDKLLFVKELIEKYGKKVLNIIYYKENYDKKYKK